MNMWPAAARMVQKMKCGFQCNIFIFWRIREMKEKNMKRRERERGEERTKIIAQHLILPRIGLHI